jgi:acyl-CoA dehydrogenase
VLSRAHLLDDLELRPTSDLPRAAFRDHFDIVDGSALLKQQRGEYHEHALQLLAVSMPPRKGRRSDLGKECFMPFALDESVQKVRAEALSLAARCEPFAAEADEMSTMHPATLAEFRKSGLSSLMVPKMYGGRFDEIDPLAVCVAREAMMRTSAHLDSVFALQGIGSYAISRAGTDEQKRTWLPRVASAEVLAGLALTEPVAGSDLKGIQTTARTEGDELVIKGAKSFISNGGDAAFYTTLVKETDPDGPRYSLILVPASSGGLSVAPSPEIIAPHVLGELTYDDVRVPQSARLGGSGDGFKHVLATLAVFRISVAGAACGLMQGAIEEATRHVRSREQFGRPLLKHGPVSSLLADAWADYEAARLLTYATAEAARVDAAANLERSSLAKLFSTEAASRVADRCVQVMGRWGLVRGSKIEKYFRQARPMRVYEGASEVLRLGIAARLGKEVDSWT